MKAVLGIDVGLSSVRAAVVAADGRLLGHGRASQPPLRGTGRDAERHVTDWTEAIPRVVRDSLVAAGSPAIEAIGIGALGPCPVMLDATGDAIGSVPLFSLEAGAEAERQRLLSDGTIAAHLLGPDHVIPRLRLWQRQRPDDFARAVMVVDATGYLVGWLTGRPVMDPATVVDHACPGLPQPLPLPPVGAPTSIAGGLTPRIADLLALPAATPVCIGTYDSFADLAGAGVLAAGDAGLLLGTTAVIGKVVSGCERPDAVTEAGLRLTPHAGAGVMVGGWTSTSGSLIDWAGRTFADTAPSEPPGPGGSGLVMLPYFAGERAPHWDVGASGAVVGLTLSTTAADLRQAALDGVTLSIVDIADRIAAVAGAMPVIRAAGGGLRNTRWAQLTADALGGRLLAIENAGEAMGPAALALRAIGIDYQPRYDQEYAADPRRHSDFRDLLAIYRRCYPALRETMQAIKTFKSAKWNLP